MPERWERRMQALREVEAPASLDRRSVEHPRGGAPPQGPRGRIAAGIVAFAVFAAAGAFAWRAFDRVEPPRNVGATDVLPALSVSLQSSGEHQDDLLRVDTHVRYGTAHDDTGSTSTTPENAIVEWVSAADLEVFEPGPTAGSPVSVTSDGSDPRVLIGSLGDWPNFDAFERIERLPTTPGEFVIVFEADYPEGVAREILRTRLVAPGTIQLSLVEGGGADAAMATASVDGALVDGFLSASSFQQSDLIDQTIPSAPDFGTTPRLEISAVAGILLTERVDGARAGLSRTYEGTPNELPLDLTVPEPTLAARPGSYLLAVQATWRHGQVGWTSDGTRESARFFFPVEVVDDGAAPIPAVSPSPTEPVPTETSSASEKAAEQIAGVPFAVCRVLRLPGHFGELGDEALVFEEERVPGAGCIGSEGFQHVAIARNGEVTLMSDRITDAIEEDAWRVWPYAAPDLDGDGIAEIALAKDEGWPSRRIWLVRVTDAGIATVEHPCGAGECRAAFNGVIGSVGHENGAVTPEGFTCEGEGAQRRFVFWQVSAEDPLEVLIERYRLLDTSLESVSEETVAVADPSGYPDSGAESLCGSPASTMEEYPSAAARAGSGDPETET